MKKEVRKIGKKNTNRERAEESREGGKPNKMRRGKNEMKRRGEKTGNRKKK